jgi:hypothetical protein
VRLAAGEVVELAVQLHAFEKEFDFPLLMPL